MSSEQIESGDAVEALDQLVKSFSMVCVLFVYVLVLASHFVSRLT